MKTKLFILSLLAAVITIPTAAQSAKQIELSFNYQKQSGPGSNQYAVWVENSKGDVVKTLFVTNFTTKGRGNNPDGTRRRGYTFRPTCVPTWIKNAKVADMTDDQLDGVSGATPAASGVQTFTWDFKDAAGKAVPAGDYKILLEATLYNNSIVLYSGTFSTKDKAGDVKLTSSVTELDEQHKNMVTEVKAQLK